MQEVNDAYEQIKNPGKNSASNSGSRGTGGYGYGYGGYGGYGYNPFGGARRYQYNGDPYKEAVYRYLRFRQYEQALHNEFPNWLPEANVSIFMKMHDNQ
jgi:hypothetical protein